MHKEHNSDPSAGFADLQNKLTRYFFKYLWLNLSRDMTMVYVCIEKTFLIELQITVQKQSCSIWGCYFVFDKNH